MIHVHLLTCRCGRCQPMERREGGKTLIFRGVKSMATTVVNLRKEAYDAYIGRAGHGHDGYFGNPFRPGDGWSEPREAIIDKFRDYFLRRVAYDAEFRRRVLELRGKRLGCFCKPAACHGDIIAAWIDSQPEQAEDCNLSGPLEHGLFGDRYLEYR